MNSFAQFIIVIFFVTFFYQLLYLKAMFSSNFGGKKLSNVNGGKVVDVNVDNVDVNDVNGNVDVKVNVDVNGDVNGKVNGDVNDKVNGNVDVNVNGDVNGKVSDVNGDVKGDVSDVNNQLSELRLVGNVLLGKEVVNDPLPMTVFALFLKELDNSSYLSSNQVKRIVCVLSVFGCGGLSVGQVSWIMVTDPLGLMLFVILMVILILCLNKTNQNVLKLILFISLNGVVTYCFNGVAIWFGFGVVPTAMIVFIILVLTVFNVWFIFFHLGMRKYAKWGIGSSVAFCVLNMVSGVSVLQLLFLSFLVVN
jgi:hypothetical protein